MKTDRYHPQPINFAHATRASEEDSDPFKEHHCPRKENVVSAIVKEINNHANRKHWNIVAIRKCLHL